MRSSAESRQFYAMVRNYLTDFLPNTRNLSLCTIQAARDSLNLLLDYCTEVRNIPLLKIDLTVAGNVDLIKDFLSWLKDDRNCSNATLNQRLSCLRSFFRFAAYEDASYVSIYQSLTTIPRRKVPKNKTVDFMSEDALKAILSEPDLNTRTGLRDAFYMALMYDSAARNSEMVAVKLRDIIDGKAPYVLVNGKGRKKRSIPLMSRTMDIYQLYMKKFHPGGQPDDYLFYTVHHGDHFPMSVDNVAKFVSRYAESARGHCNEVPAHVHPHMFRRSRAMHLYRNGMPLALLAEFLGHENPETTLIYASADTEMKRQAIEKASIHLAGNDQNATIPQWSTDDEMIRKLYGLK